MSASPSAIFSCMAAAGRDLFSTRSLAGEMEEKVSRVVCVEQSAFFETLFRERVPQLPCSDFLQMLKANFFFNENARETVQAI